MKAYWNYQPAMNIRFGSKIERNYALPDTQRPYLCVYLQAELDEFIARHKNKQVGFLMAERYLRNEVQPFLSFRGEVLLAKEYPDV
jgi:hypothetical protein